MELIGSSCVVIADQHNPSILNPDWLIKTEIIDPEWRLVDPSITTPLFANCSYVNGVQLVLEPNKLTVSSLPSDNNSLSAELPQIVRKYVDALPHVPYKQLGNNFRFSTEVEGTLSKLKNRLIKEGTWNTDNISRIKTTLQYFCNSYSINLTVESSDTTEESKPDEEASTLILDFNYHRELGDLSSFQHGVESWQNDYNDAAERANKIVEEIN